jgi:AraC-like DNA-binding protein
MCAGRGYNGSPMSAAQLFTFRMVPAIAALLVKRGCDPRQLLRETGLPAEALTGDLTAPIGRIQELVDRAALVLARPLLGLDLVDVAQPGTFGLAEFVGRFAPTVRKGYETFCESVPLVNPMIEWRYMPGPREHVMQLAVPGSRDGLGTQLNEFAVGIVLKLSHAGLDKPLQTTRAWFAHARRDPALANQVNERLGCSVTFEEPTCGFAFRAEDAERAPRMADAALFDFHVTQSRNQVASLGGADVIAHVSRAIEMRLPRGDVRIEAVASALAITHRTLQRRLTEAGTSYRSVLAHVRRRRRAELHRDGVSEPKTAELLGFVDVRAMRRSLDTPE